MQRCWWRPCAVGGFRHAACTGSLVRSSYPCHGLIADSTHSARAREVFQSTASNFFLLRGLLV